jgi:hypothetical protein
LIGNSGRDAPYPALHDDAQGAVVSTYVQLFGAVLVLTAFALTLRGLLQVDSYPALWLNAVGAGILAVLALADSQWGFLALEGSWAIVATSGLITKSRRTPAAA